MTLGDLIRHLSLELGLDSTAGSDEQLLMVDWANDAVRDFLLETRSKLTSAPLSLVAGQGDYSLATLGATVMELTDAFITSGGTNYNLERVTFEELLDWRRTTQAADRSRMYAVEGDLFSVYPTPASADTITAYVVTRPTVMSADANDPANNTYGGIPNQHHPVLIAYMRWRGAIYDEKKVPHTPDQYRTQYSQLLDEAKRRMRKMGGRRVPGMKPGYPGTGGSPGTRSDVYPAV